MIPRDWLTPQELRIALGIGENQPYKMKKRGLIPKRFIREVGAREWRVHRSFLEVGFQPQQ